MVSYYANRITKPLEPLTDEQLCVRAPATMADKPDGRVSAKYRQVKTTEVINIMRDQGWFPVIAQQRNTRIEGRELFTKHLIRFQREGGALAVGDTTVQAIMTNSHDRTSAFIFNMGAYRLVCSNGMMVSQRTFGSIRVKHVGFDPHEVIRAAAKIAESGKQVVDRVGEMAQINLEQEVRVEMARRAGLMLVDEYTGYVPPEELLRTRRDDDKKTDLWTTYNVIQENIMRGGVRLFKRNPSGPFRLGREVNPTAKRVIPCRYVKTTSQPIRSIDKDMEVNSSLWELAEDFRTNKMEIFRPAAALLN